jgi:ATP-binding protein involved in chromosome partitioning
MTTATPMTTTELTQEAVLDALRPVKDPELNQSLVELGMIQNLVVCNGHVKFDIVLTTTACPLKGKIQADAENAVRALPGVASVAAQISGKTLSTLQPQQPSAGGPSAPKSPGVSPPAGKEKLPNIQNMIAVSSGKGGVGKTTVAVNLACAMVQAGAKVGVLDADIYGPNVPLMMGLQGSKLGSSPTETTADGKPKLLPPVAHGVKVMSMAFLLKEDQPVVWRGPMLDKVIRQFLVDTDWGDLDYLIIDLPPGTGDAQLTIIQATPVAGAVVVTTPQAVAIHDSRKGLNMFKQGHVPVFGIVENMSFFMGDDGKRYDLFGQGGGESAAAELSVPFLGQVPMTMALRQNADTGTPIVVAEPDSAPALALKAVANQVIAQICEMSVASA